MMRLALSLAAEATACREVPVGAVVSRGDEVIATAHNERQRNEDPLGHAELLVIGRAARALGVRRLNDCTLTVTLEPCPMCAGALVNACVGRLVYGAADSKAGACGSLLDIPRDPRLNHRVEIVGGVLEDACAELLQSFFRARRPPS